MQHTKSVSAILQHAHVNPVLSALCLVLSSFLVWSTVVSADGEFRSVLLCGRAVGPRYCVFNAHLDSSAVRASSWDLDVVTPCLGILLGHLAALGLMGSCSPPLLHTAKRIPILLTLVIFLQLPKRGPPNLWKHTGPGIGPQLTCRAAGTSGRGGQSCHWRFSAAPDRCGWPRGSCRWAGCG